MGASKKHHHTPVFYLKGFTATETDDGRLWMHDKIRRKTFPGTPKTHGHQSYYNRVKIPGLSPDFVERNILADTIETAQGVVLASVLATGKLPHDSHSRDVLLNFLSLTYVRSPVVRAAMAERTDAREKQRARDLLATADGEAKIQKLCIEYGVNFDEMAAYIRRDDYVIELDQTSVVLSMLYAQEPCLEAISRRNWCLWKVNDDAPDLVTSDIPIAPMSIKDPLTPLPAVGLESWADPGVVLVMPLSRRMVVAGYLNRVPPMRSLDVKFVALVNLNSTFYATQIYSGCDEFRIAQEKQVVIARLLDYCDVKMT